MRFSRREAALFSATLLGLGCAGEPERVDDPGVSASADANGATVYHYTVSIQDVSWRTNGVVITLTKPFRDLILAHRETLDDVTKTLIVTLDAWSYDRQHPLLLATPETLALGAGVRPSTVYAVVVKDHSGREIWAGMITTAL
jgi:hypothetical protein